MSILPVRKLEIACYGAPALAERMPRWEAYYRKSERLPLSLHPAWLTILRRGLGHTPYVLEAVENGKLIGLLPLASVRGPLFGHFLVSLPYLNSGGVRADDDGVAHRLIDAAVRLANDLEVKYLELRHERVLNHPAFNQRVSSKVHMRLALPATAKELWDGFPAKVRNQLRKAEVHGLTPAWGGRELLPEFYEVFSRNMRDLGTPVYGRGLFRAILEEFPERAELCIVRAGPKPYAAGLLLHGWGVTEVPSASSLREFNFTNANMLLYWHLLQRAVERGQAVFDFGRSTRDGNTFRFKKQWGAAPEPAEWQYYLRTGSAKAARPDNPSYGRLIRVWQRLPVPLTRLIGPAIVRGIP